VFKYSYSQLLRVRASTYEFWENIIYPLMKRKVGQYLPLHFPVSQGQNYNSPQSTALYFLSPGLESRILYVQELLSFYL
jgi:hypothetical protein